MSKFRNRKEAGDKLDLLSGEGSNNVTGDLTGITMSELTATMFGAQVPTITRQQAQQSQQAPMNAIVIEDDGALTYAGYTLTGVGLVDNPQASFDDWNALGEMLFRLEGSIQWLIGDWLIIGAGKWGSMYTEAVERFGRAEKTLRNYKVIATSFNFTRRRDSLTFGHHEAVSALHFNIQEEFLDYAEENALSVASLRKAIKDWKNEGRVEQQPLLTDDWINPVKRATSMLTNPETIAINPRGAIQDAERAKQALDELIRYAKGLLD